MNPETALIFIGGVLIGGVIFAVKITREQDRLRRYAHAVADELLKQNPGLALALTANLAGANGDDEKRLLEKHLMMASAHKVPPATLAQHFVDACMEDYPGGAQ